MSWEPHVRFRSGAYLHKQPQRMSAQSEGEYAEAL